MEENRRQTDKRMDSLEKDIRELRESFIETHDTVIAINATLNDGMKSAIIKNQQSISLIQEDIKEMVAWMSKNESIIAKTPEQRLLDCPFKKELSVSLKKRINWWLVILFIILIITNNWSTVWNIGTKVVLKFIGV